MRWACRVAKIFYIRNVDQGPQSPTTAPVLVATTLSTTSIQLTWNLLDPTFTYVLRRAGSVIFTGSALTYTDTGLSPSTLYSYTVSALNVAGEGPQSAPPATATTQASGGAVLVKFHPGHYMLSNNVDGDPIVAGGGTTGRNQSEMNTLGAYGTNVQGYVSQWNWISLVVSQGVFKFGVGASVDRIGNDFLALQKTPGCNGKRYGILVKSYRDPISINSANYINPWTSNAPSYVLNGGTVYGNKGPNNTQRGYVLSQNTGGATYNFTYAEAAKYVPGVMTEYIALFQGIAAAIVPTCTINGVTYSGLTYDTHPYIELVGDYSEYSLVYGAPFIPGDYTASGEITQWGRLYQSMAAAFPHTLTTGYISYGNATGTTQKIPNLQTLINSGNAAGSFAFSNADTYPNWTVYGTGVTSQLLFSGNSFTSTSDATKYVSGGGTDLRGKMPSIATVQGYDYGNLSSATINNIYKIAIGNSVGPAPTLNTGVNATHIMWDGFGVSGSNFAYPLWVSTIYPLISNPANPTVQAVPANLAGRTNST